jgi:hypothetical protein
VKTNRRKVPKAHVIRLAKQGLRSSEIARELGEVDGAYFHPAAISNVLRIARKRDKSIPEQKRGPLPRQMELPFTALVELSTGKLEDP